MRLLLVPVFVCLHLFGEPVWALVCFAVAALSDGLDGLLARALNQRTRLGAILDPIADKLLVFAALCTLIAERQLPPWLLALVIFRDSWMIIGAIVVRRKNLEIPTAPTRIGKYATFGMTLLVVLSLMDQAANSPALHAYVVVLSYTAGLCVAVSTLQYFSRFGHLFFAPARRHAP
jgi:cardiolipin synthase